MGLGLLVFSIGASVSPVSAVDTTVVSGGENMPSALPMEPTGEGMLPGTTAKIEYALPYPGILPDHPLYFLKRFRDTILERLINDPVRKAEFFVLQGDKRLQMGVLLFQAGKKDIAESTVSKAEKYLEQAVAGLVSHKKNGGSVPTYVTEKLEKSTAKHEEVITDLLGKADPAQQAGLQGSLKMVKEVRGSLSSLK